MCNRIAQLVERGTAFRRASLWTINTIMNAGALGVEVAIAGKLRSERAHFEKHSSGVVPKSGDVAGRVVKVGITHVLTKMGLMGIQLKIALKNEIPQEFEFADVLSDTAMKPSPEPTTIADNTKLEPQTVDTSANTEAKKEQSVTIGDTKNE